MSESLAALRDFVRASETTVSWQHALKRAIRDAAELCRRLGLDEGCTTAACGGEGERQFPVFVPLEFLRRMRPRDRHDPLLRQVLPLEAESEPAAGFDRDPVGEVAASGEAALSDGLIQKYPGRVLLMAHSACAIHCRYCFRRHFPYEAVSGGGQMWSAALERIAADHSIGEVILSGGDPLLLTDQSLRQLVDRIAAIPHVRRLRIHSRMPVVIPQRVTDALLQTLRGTRLATWLVVHCNHAQELDQDTLDNLARFIEAGIPVLNQAVLLAGVNDSLDALRELCEGLVDARIQPYYLHQLDRVAGAAHFEVNPQRGSALVEQLRGCLPGYAVPTFVREVAGESSKSLML